jgi:hypothetical protein
MQAIEDRALLRRFRVAAEVPDWLDLCVSARWWSAMFKEACMGLPCRGIFSSLLVAGFVTCAVAEDASHDPATTGATSAHPRRPVLTGKERLGPKWSDEQRIDNCKVPIDKRGTRPRPSACPNAFSS